MNKLQYPLHVTFKIGTISNDFILKDNSEQTIAYIRQKLLKFIEHVEVFSDESRSTKTYDIKANKWLDFSATYTFSDKNGLEIGRIVRKGWSSLWKASYQILDTNMPSELRVIEENPWSKVFDGILSQVPFLNFFTGYFFHPSYIVLRQDGTKLVQLKKVNSFFGRRFIINNYTELNTAEEERIILGLMMMILLERTRG